MRGFVKRVMATILAMTLLFIFIPQKIEAAAPQGSVHNPIKLGTGGKYNKTWTKSYGDDFYVSFKMSKQGYATINLSKIYDGRDTLVYYTMYLYDKNGSLVWDCQTAGQKSNPSSKYTYKVGLKKGSYLLKINPVFNSYYGSIKSTVSVKTTANAYWEIENNDSFAKATTIKLKQKYTAVYGDNKTPREDFFKVKLTKGKKYRISIGNYYNLFSHNTLCDVFYPNKNEEVKDYYNRYSDAGYIIRKNGSTTIKATKTGYYYIRFENDFGYANPGQQYTITVKQK